MNINRANRNNNINSNPSFGKLAFFSAEAKAAFRESLRRQDNPTFAKELADLIEAHQKIKTLVITDGKELIEVPNGTYSTQKTFLVTLFDALYNRLTSSTATIKKAKKPIDKLIENCPIITPEQISKTLREKASASSHPIGLILTSDPAFADTDMGSMRF